MRIENDLRSLSHPARPGKVDQINRPVNGGQDKIAKIDSALPALIEPVDQFIPSAQASAMPPKGYGYGQLGQPSIDRLKIASPEPFNDLRNLVRRLLESQGLVFKDLAGLNGIFILDEKARAEAELAVSATGPLGVQVLSNKIVGFAQVICGKDKLQLASLKDAIEQGSLDAAWDLGGQLDTLCQKTKTLALEKLASWAKS